MLVLMHLMNRESLKEQKIISIKIDLSILYMHNLTSDIEFKYLIVNDLDKKYGVTVNTVGLSVYSSERDLSGLKSIH